jgi:capsular exopolysaccharide synthesis family protein
MANPQLITLTDPRSPTSEAYRTLRTNLMFSSVDKPLHTLLVTSCAQPEDKSETAANLAVAFAQAGHRTILVDADLRQPAQAALWGAEGQRGLTDMLLDEALLATPPFIRTDVENLEVLLAGKAAPNPADALSSRRMDEIIGILKARAAYVVFESPPVLAASDAALLSTRMDGTLLVVRAGSTRRDHLTRAKESLDRVHARIVGTTLTNAPRARATA